MKESTTPDSVDARRLHGLLDALRADTADLVAVLERILTTACDLVDAAHGTLTVLGADGSLEHFVHHGLDAAAAAQLRDRSTGAPIGAVTPVRVADLAPDGPVADGACIHSLLAVPIRVGREAFGELRVADPRVGWFDAQDEDLVSALAASAGAAIEKARLLRRARRSRDWLDASARITRTLLADAGDQALVEIVARALDVADADYAALVLPEGEVLRVSVAKGAGAADFQGRVFETDSRLGHVVVAGQTRRTADFHGWAGAKFVDRHGFGPAMLAPLVDRNGARGAVLLLRRRDRPRFTTDDVHHAAGFADQVALALELNDARADAARLRLLEERHRIAQDLHDNVMQRLFAIGVGLQALGDALPPAAAERLRRHVADLDETIEQIRVRVFGLRVADPPAARRGWSPGRPAASTRANPGKSRSLRTPEARPEDPATVRNR